MRTVRAGVMAVVAAMLATAACGESRPRAVSTRPALTTTAGAATATTATAVPGAPTSTIATAVPAGLGAPTGTRPYLVERPVKVPPVARLTGVRTGHQDGFDRVVFDFEGALPGRESVQYVAAVTQDASGAPVVLQGKAFLKVVFSSAEAHTADGSPSFAPGKRFATGLSSVEEVALAGDFEGYVSFGLGLRAKAGFRVFELSNPSRVVIDVA